MVHDQTQWAGEQRASIRMLICRSVEIRNSSAPPIRGRMQNISEAGCCVAIDHEGRFEAGRVYCLKLRGLELLHARIAWADQMHVGFTFATPLHLAIMEHTAMASFSMSEGEL
jgi:hypothetical protein